MSNTIIAKYKNKQISIDNIENKVFGEYNSDYYIPNLFVDDKYKTNVLYKSRFSDIVVRAIAKVDNTYIGNIIIYISMYDEIVFNTISMYDISIIDTNFELLDEI